MKINNTAHLRKTLETLVREERIAPADVETLLQSPEKLRAVLVREDAFDAPTQKAFDAVLGASGHKSRAEDDSTFSSTGFAKQNVHALLMNEKSTGTTPWFQNVDASLPPLFDVGVEAKTMSIGSVAIQAQELIDMMSKVGQDRAQWRGLPLVDVNALIRNIR